MGLAFSRLGSFLENILVQLEIKLMPGVKVSQTLLLFLYLISLPRNVMADMLKFHGVKMTYMQAWRVKDKAIKMLRGDPSESYAKIPGYLYVLDKYHPGSVVGSEVTDENKFLYAFVALEASIRAWEYCRPVVVVDGATLKCTHGGTMLITSTLDPGGGMGLQFHYVIFFFINLI